LVTSSQDGTARVWNTHTSDQTMPPLSHPESIMAAAFASDSERVISASRNALIYSWELAPARALAPILLHGAAVQRCASIGKADEQTSPCLASVAAPFPPVSRIQNEPLIGLDIDPRAKSATAGGHERVFALLVDDG
jgi:WD40 repeat protein